MLTPQERLRYARHLTLPNVGDEGQRKIKDARVLIVGAGGLGAPVGLYLAAAGVGRIGLVDFDVVDTSNLQRQVIHGSSNEGHSKVASAAERLRDLNPLVIVDEHAVRITSDNARALVGDYDLVVDASDNYPTRYLLNDACVLGRKTNIYGAIFQFEGQATVFAPGGPCYRCLYPAPPPPSSVQSCVDAGVFGVLPGLIGLVQATECLKVILGMGQTLEGRLLSYDALDMRFMEHKLSQSADCVLCHGKQTTLIDYAAFCGLAGEISAQEVWAKRERGHVFTLIDVREHDEREALFIEGSLHIPLGELEQHLSTLSGEIVVHCQSGKRSARAVDILKQRGLSNVRSMSGGILAWAKIEERQ